MNRTLLLTSALILGAMPLAASAQQIADASSPPPSATPVAAVEPAGDEAPDATATEALNPEATTETTDITVRYPNFRPPNQLGLNVFEPPKSQNDRLAGSEPRLRIGAGFAQQFQALDHSNTAAARMTPNTTTPAPGDSINLNELTNLNPAFNLAAANLTANALLTDGVQVNLDVYLSSRHHNETWVKGGYVQADRLTFLGLPVVDRIMDYVTLKVGHFEVNYGDAHFRRTDNGNALYNPFVGSYIMDAFTTEIGAEVYVRHAGFLAMGGVTNGLLNTTVVEDPNGSTFAYYGKVGYDRQVTDDLRLRLTGSAYGNDDAGRSTLYGGDRAGSRYFFVGENTQATSAAQFSSGLINPGFSEEILALQINPFVKFGGLELFGVVERASGRSLLETEDVGRAWTQYAVDGVYRLLPREQAYVGARWNRVEGPLTGPAVNGAITTTGNEVGITRYELAAGWFPTRNLLLKAEYVRQSYDDFAPTDIRNGLEFDGFMVEAAVTF